MSSGMSAERSAAAGQFLDQTAELVGFLPKISQELAVAKLATRHAVASENPTDAEAELWHKDESRWLFLNQEAHEQFNEAFEWEHAENNAAFLVSLSDWPSFWDRQERETDREMTAAMHASRLSVDRVIEESYQLDAHLFEQPRWLEQPRWRDDPREEADGLSLWQSEGIRWQNDVQRQLDEIMETSRLSAHNKEHVFKAGRDFKILEPTQAREVVQVIGSRGERTKATANRLARFLIGTPDRYEDPDKLREVTRRMADIIVEKEQDKVYQARRNRMLGRKEEGGRR